MLKPNDRRFTEYANMILDGLASWRIPIYPLTVPEAEISKRRLKNKVARRQRKLNRRKTGRP